MSLAVHFGYGCGGDTDGLADAARRVSDQGFYLNAPTFRQVGIERLTLGLALETRSRRDFNGAVEATGNPENDEDPHGLFSTIRLRIAEQNEGSNY